MNILNIKNQKGFSLIEMMVVVVILGLIVLGLVIFFTGGARSWIAGQSQLEAQRNARQAIDRMVREIRHGKIVISGETKSITVTVPALGSESAYNITYSWSGISGDPIYRDSNPLIDNVINLIFTYAYPSGSTDISDVSKVHILLEVDVDKDSNPDVTLNTDVNLRNFSLPE